MVFETGHKYWHVNRISHNCNILEIYHRILVLCYTGIVSYITPFTSLGRIKRFVSKLLHALGRFISSVYKLRELPLFETINQQDIRIVCATTDCDSKSLHQTTYMRTNLASGAPGGIGKNGSLLMGRTNLAPAAAAGKSVAGGT